MMKNYVLKLLQQCSEEQFGQDAVEWAIIAGFVHLSYKVDDDVRSIMLRYDEIIEAYRRALAQTEEENRMTPAPMQRAGQRRRFKAGSSDAPIGQENAA